jgi:ribosomal protein S6
MSDKSCSIVGDICLGFTDKPICKNCDRCKQHCVCELPNFTGKAFHVVNEQNASKIVDWLFNRGGIAVWSSINLSNPGQTWTAPLNDADGNRLPKQNWQMANEPSRIITSVDEIVVSTDKEVKRFHVGVRMGSQGMMMKVTDGGTRRIRAAVAKAGEGAYYRFDYETQEAVIMAPDKQVMLSEWMRTHVKPLTTFPDEVVQQMEKPGVVCANCGATVNNREYSKGETDCCGADVVPEEQYSPSIEDDMLNGRR